MSAGEDVPADNSGAFYEAGSGPTGAALARNPGPIDDESQWGTAVPGQVAYRKPLKQTATKPSQAASTSSYGSRYPTPAQRLTTSNDPRVNPDFDPRTAPGAGPRGYDETKGTAPREEPLQGVHPETALLPGAGLKTIASMAKMFANRDKGPYFSQQALENNPTRQLTGPSKAELMARDRAARAESRREEMLNENAANYGLNPNAPGYASTAQALRDQIGGKDFTVKKKGGSVKAKGKSKSVKMASGGSARSSASKRGDGIASKGRTRGKMY
jgi:hypothetical protein